MKQLIVAIGLLLCGLSLKAQTEVRGKVIDGENQTPMEFASITITDVAGAILSGTISDQDGGFQLIVPQGNHTLQVLYVGQTLYNAKITVGNLPIDLGKLEVKNTVALSEVVVVGNKKLIERQVDRLVFNVEASSKSSQGDALEVLKVTPGVRVQNDKIAMIGKNNLRVMVNGKAVQLSDQELTNFLRSIASEDIKNVEVITAPPAKYEAAGSGGLININLKQAKKDAWNAQVKSTFAQRQNPMGAFGSNFSYSKGKLSIASSANYLNGKFVQEFDYETFFPDALWTATSTPVASVEVFTGRVDLNYRIGPMWSMGGQYLYNQSSDYLDDNPGTFITDYESGRQLGALQSDNITDLNPKIHSINYNTEIRLDTIGKSILLNLDYFSYSNPDTRTYEGTSVLENSLTQYYAGTNINQQEVDNYSAKIDVEYPTGFANLSFGSKISGSKSTNQLSLFNSGLQDIPVSDFPLARNSFEYTEAIQAVYFSANKKLGKQLSLQVGLRLEATQTLSSLEMLDIENDYTKLFPTVYLSYEASEQSTFAFNYSRRIERPGFTILNPNLYFISPFQTEVGNPFLQPAFIDNIELSHTYGALTTRAYFSIENGLFGQIPLPDVDTNIKSFVIENYNDNRRAGMAVDYFFDKVKWWSSNNSLDVNYVVSKFELGEEKDEQTGVNATVSTYNDFSLNTDKTWLLGLNYRYSFPGVDGIFRNKPVSSLSLSLQCLLMDRKLNLTLRGTDIFRSENLQTEATTNGIFQRSDYYSDNQSVQVSVSYKFGNSELKTKRHKTGNSSEKSRVL